MQLDLHYHTGYSKSEVIKSHCIHHKSPQLKKKKIAPWPVVSLSEHAIVTQTSGHFQHMTEISSPNFLPGSIDLVCTPNIHYSGTHFLPFPPKEELFPQSLFHNF